MIKKANTVKLNVKPVFIALVHKYFYEGPCRFGKGDALQPGYDAIMEREMYKQFCEDVKNYMPQEVNILEPVYVERYDDWNQEDEMYEKIMEDNDRTDLYLFRTYIGRNEIVLEIAQRTKKPAAVVPTACCEVLALSAALSSRGLEFYAARTWPELATDLKALRLRKVLHNTNVLLSSRFNSTMSFSSVDTFRSLDDVTAKLGVKFRYKNIHELLDQMSPAVEGGNPTTPGRETPDLTEEDMAEVKRLADEMTRDAKEVHVDREFLEKSLIAYVTVKKNLDMADCNAFTVPCPDVCSTRRINEQQFTFCMTHSLLNEQGIPSACEYDINALLSMMLLTGVSYKAPYMGNCVPLPMENGKLNRDAVESSFFVHEEDLDAIEKRGGLNDLYVVEHSVPNRKMHGLDGEQADFAIRHFAYEQGFGAVLRYDFNKDVDQVITMARFSPDVKKLFVGKGTIVGGGGYDYDNCNTAVYFKPQDQKTFYDAQKYVGNHMPLVYGDYTQELKRLGEILGLEVIEA
ncbi:fucose isomerase [Christensenella timonensis]|uniref:fucose isomerase n=1 Tax=Christensenella timonensis TaxID=1816678 RepID=UPI00082E9BB7|nr:fucose isomerase [Christensenella timonensis]